MVILNILFAMGSPHWFDSGRLMPRWLSLATIPVTAFGLLLMGMPVSPAAANSYSDCAKDLQDAGVSAPDAASACAAALHPKDIANCVSDIKDDVGVSASEALWSCTRVRRPLELASCVGDISDDMEAADPKAVLEGCRRSLLPHRFAECVLGLGGEVQGAAIPVMKTCLDAKDKVAN